MATTVTTFPGSAGEYKSQEWNEDDRETFDAALLRLARIPIEERRPRNATGQIFVWKENNVVVVRRNETLDRVFKKLTVENFLSCPVVDDTVSSQYCGVVDILDLVCYTTDVLFSGDTSPAWIDFWQRSSKFRETQVWEVMKTSRYTSRYRSPVDIYHTLPDGFSLLHAFEVLARTNCHRIPVVNGQNRIVGIYTESMAVSDIRQSLHLFGRLADLRVSKMLMSKNVHSMKDTDRAIDAFRKMAELNVSGMPVTDEEGVLESSISIRDLRGVGTGGEHFARLFWTIREFREQARKDFPKQAPATHWTSQEVPRSARFVTPNDTFADVVRSFNDGNLHRIYVCSQSSVDLQKPTVIGVISLRDLIAQTLISFGAMHASTFAMLQQSNPQE